MTNDRWADAAWTRRHLSSVTDHLSLSTHCDIANRFTGGTPVPLEAVTDPDLHDPGFSRPDQDLGLTEVRTAQIAIDAVEVRMVRQVQRLEAELQVVALGDLDVLDQRRVKVVEARPGENVAADTAEAHPGSRRIHEQRVRRRDAVGFIAGGDVGGLSAGESAAYLVVVGENAVRRALVRRIRARQVPDENRTIMPDAVQVVVAAQVLRHAVGILGVSADPGPGHKHLDRMAGVKLVEPGQLPAAE